MFLLWDALIDSMWSINGKCRWVILVQVMACCLMAPGHCLNQTWLIMNEGWIINQAHWIEYWLLDYVSYGMSCFLVHCTYRVFSNTSIPIYIYKYSYSWTRNPIVSCIIKLILAHGWHSIMKLSHCWFKWWLVTWWHQAIAWTHVGLSSSIWYSF